MLLTVILTFLSTVLLRASDNFLDYIDARMFEDEEEEEGEEGHEEEDDGETEENL